MALLAFADLIGADATTVNKEPRTRTRARRGGAPLAGLPASDKLRPIPRRANTRGHRPVGSSGALTPIGDTASMADRSSSATAGVCPLVSLGEQRREGLACTESNWLPVGPGCNPTSEDYRMVSCCVIVAEAPATPSHSRFRRVSQKGVVPPPIRGYSPRSRSPATSVVQPSISPGVFGTIGGLTWSAPCRQDVVGISFCRSPHGTRRRFQRQAGLPVTSLLRFLVA